MQPIHPSGGVGNTPPVQLQGQVVGGQQQAPAVHPQLQNAASLLANLLDQAPADYMGTSLMWAAQIENSRAVAALLSAAVQLRADQPQDP
jgi:hypothetical protein